MSEGVSKLGEQEMMEQANLHGFPRLKVLCDVHRPMKVWKGWEECTRPECQALMAKRRDEVRAAGAPTEAQKQAWRDQRKGLAGAKPSLREEGP